MFQKTDLFIAIVVKNWTAAARLLHNSSVFVKFTNAPTQESLSKPNEQLISKIITFFNVTVLDYNRVKSLF